MQVQADVDPRLLQAAIRATGVRNPDRLITAALRALIARAAMRRMQTAARYQPVLRPAPRRRRMPE